jgi:hypothetical protein
VERIGIDLGGVIIKREKNADAQFPAVPGAFMSIKRLREAFGENIIIISAVGQSEVAYNISMWLGSQNFFEETGLFSRQIYFCLKREEKVKICKRFGITHFIDDRMEILSSLIGIVPNLYLFSPDPAEIKPYAKNIRHVHQISNWTEVLKLIANQKRAKK